MASRQTHRKPCCGDKFAGFEPRVPGLEVSTFYPQRSEDPGTHGHDQTHSSYKSFFDFERWDSDQMKVSNPTQVVQNVDSSITEISALDQFLLLDPCRLQEILELDDHEENDRDLETATPAEAKDSDIGKHGDEEISTRNKKRKRTEAENAQALFKQRVRHVKIERNRRQVIKDHIAVLKRMLPSHMLIKDDQASVLGAVVEFICELQVLEKRLEDSRAQKLSNESLTPGFSYPLDPPWRAAASKPEFQQVVGDDARVSDLKDAYQVQTAWGTVVVAELDTFVDVVILDALCRPMQITQILLALESLNLDVMQMSQTKEKNHDQTSCLFIRTKLGFDYKFTTAELAIALHQSLSMG
ncbi:hypothetical protein R1flu_009293 [Riccia fluitans]|uniref:BHLH domain-containing protein n=1 Tax=Riccia fluitans TaxID=41844 RepID=A0ABD1Z1P4_9MARC